MERNISHESIINQIGNFFIKEKIKKNKTFSAKLYKYGLFSKKLLGVIGFILCLFLLNIILFIKVQQNEYISSRDALLLGQVSNTQTCSNQSILKTEISTAIQYIQYHQIFSIVILIILYFVCIFTSYNNYQISARLFYFFLTFCFFIISNNFDILKFILVVSNSNIAYLNLLGPIEAFIGIFFMYFTKADYPIFLVGLILNWACIYIIDLAIIFNLFIECLQNLISFICIFVIVKVFKDFRKNEKEIKIKLMCAVNVFMDAAKTISRKFILYNNMGESLELNFKQIQNIKANFKDSISNNNTNKVANQNINPLIPNNKESFINKQRHKYRLFAYNSYSSDNLIKNNQKVPDMSNIESNNYYKLVKISIKKLANENNKVAGKNNKNFKENNSIKHYQTQQIDTNDIAARIKRPNHTDSNTSYIQLLNHIKAMNKNLRLLTQILYFDFSLAEEVKMAFFLYKKYYIKLIKDFNSSIENKNKFNFKQGKTFPYIDNNNINANENQEIEQSKKQKNFSALNLNCYNNYNKISLEESSNEFIKNNEKFFANASNNGKAIKSSCLYNEPIDKEILLELTKKFSNLQRDFIEHLLSLSVSKHEEEISSNKNIEEDDKYTVLQSKQNGSNMSNQVNKANILAKKSKNKSSARHANDQYFQDFSNDANKNNFLKQNGEEKGFKETINNPIEEDLNRIIENPNALKLKNSGKIIPLDEFILIGYLASGKNKDDLPNLNICINKKPHIIKSNQLDCSSKDNSNSYSKLIFLRINSINNKLEILIKQESNENSKSENFLNNLSCKICHEIKNPIINILGTVKKIKEGLNHTLNLIQSNYANNLTNANNSAYKPGDTHNAYNQLFLNREIANFIDDLYIIKNFCLYINYVIDDLDMIKYAIKSSNNKNNKNNNKDKDILQRLQERINNNKIEINLHKEIESIKKIFENKIKFANIPIKIKFTKVEETNGTEKKMKLNLFFLKKIIFILLDNAVKFSKKGIIKIEYKLMENYLFLSITDEGKGILEENIQRIGDFLYKEDPINNPYGLGLGFFSFKLLVSGFSGMYNINSIPNLGTVVEFHIPINFEFRNNNNNIHNINNLTKDNYPNSFIQKNPNDCCNKSFQPHLLYSYKIRQRDSENFKINLKSNLNIDLFSHDQSQNKVTTEDRSYQIFINDKNIHENNKNNKISATKLTNSNIRSKNVEQLKNSIMNHKTWAVDQLNMRKLSRPKLSSAKLLNMKFNFTKNISSDDKLNQRKNKIKEIDIDIDLSRIKENSTRSNINPINNKSCVDYYKNSIISNFTKLDKQTRSEKNLKLNIDYSKLTSINNILKYTNISMKFDNCQYYNSDEYNNTIHSIRNSRNIREKLNILIIDDEEIIRKSEAKLIRKYFLKLNFDVNVIEAADGAEGLYKIYLSFLNNVKYDLIITDETMNFIKGTKMASIIKSLIRENILYDVKICMITSYEVSVIEKFDLQKNIDLIGTKPLSENYLDLVIGKLFYNEY